MQEQSEIVGNTVRLFHALNCTSPYSDVSLQCLRDIPADSLFSRVVALGLHILFTPSVDGEFLPRPPEELLESGEVRGVPSMWGTLPFESHFYFVPLGEDVLDNGMSPTQALRYLPYTHLIL